HLIHALSLHDALPISMPNGRPEVLAPGPDMISPETGRGMGPSAMDGESSGSSLYGNRREGLTLRSRPTQKPARKPRVNGPLTMRDRKSTRLNSSHVKI